MSDMSLGLLIACVSGMFLYFGLTADRCMGQYMYLVLFTVTLVQAVSHYVRGLIGGRR